jgi:N-acetylmuramoyl-L-alanine amidase
MSKVICLDAGHGGEDPGASGNGIIEKDFALDMVSRIGHHLRARGLETVLTRDDDTFVAINRRAFIARKADSVLFLSIHCNASTSKSAQGVEVFVSANDKRGSSKIANVLIRKISNLTPRGVKPDNQSQHTSLGVLRGTCSRMWSLLLELGFCTNPHDAGLMNDNKQREAWALAIAGVVADAVG